MRLKDIQSIFHKELDAMYGRDEVESFFYILTDEFLGMQRLAFSLQPNFTINKEEEQPLFEALTKLRQEIPIQYILGKTEFFGFSFNVNEHTLIPRPETEELIHWISQKANRDTQLTILDIGTGSGCIAISLAKEFPNSKVLSLDVSEDALKVAQVNALQNNVDIDFIPMDILKTAYGVSEFKNMKFDLIVSNPPYVRNLERKEMKNNVLNNEPGLALFVDDNEPLIFYKAITKFAGHYLKQGGSLYFEINQYLGDEMIDLLTDSKFIEIELKKDLFGNDRMLKAIANFE